MNLHVPQGIQASAEASTLMKVPTKIISPQNNGPIAGIVQDGLTGSYLLTNTWSTGHTLVKKTVFMNCVVSSGISMKRYNDLLKRAQKWYPEYISPTFELEDVIPGKLMFSIVFPPDLYYERRTETSKEFPVVMIEDGVLLPTSGPVCKKIIGNKRGSLIHILWKEFSPDTTVDFLTEVQFLTDYWLPNHGFSMGIADCQTTKFDQVVKSLETIEIEIKKLKTKYKGDKLEEKIISILNEAGNIGPQIAEKSMNKGERNALTIMRDSGAKGNTANTAAIVTFLGQQNLGGKPIPKTLSGGTRSLPRFEQGDTSPKASGFISSRYIDGLDPHEVCYHAMAGREGVIATAITTAITGYIQKKISRKLEDHKICYDGSVRDANGRIIQFMYGDDGLDPQKLYGCSGIKFPFFANVKSIATRINKTLGKKARKLTLDEIDIILEYVIAGAPGMQTSIVKNVTSIFRNLLKEEFKKIKLHESSIPEFCHRIVELLETSKSQHGDAVGLIAAASIGEPTTQLSVLRETPVVIRLLSETKQIPIGDFIDKLLEDHNDVQKLGEGSVVARPINDICIQTVDPLTQKIKWMKITEISRHPSNGDLVKVTTKSKRSVTTTLAHSHLSLLKGKIVPKLASVLKIGDKIPVYGGDKVFWDEITTIQYLPDPKEYVYDFGVDGNHTFMVANGIFVHNTLNFFHSTGHKGKDVSLGVPRFKEILNATESPKNPSCTIHFNDPILKEGTQIAKELESRLISAKDPTHIEILIKKNKAKCIKLLEDKRKKLEEIHIISFLKEYKLRYVSSDVDPDTDCSPVKIITYKKYKKQWWVSLSEKLNEPARVKPQYWVLEILLDVEKMCKKSYTTEEIANIIEDKGEGCLSCISSPNNMGIIEIRTDFDEIRCFLKEKGHIMADNTLNPKDLPHRLINTNLEFFLCRDSLVSFIKSICVGGMSKISHAFPVKNTETHEWIIETTGSNFQAILAFPEIDPINTMTNEIWEIYRTLGIEAVRKFLIEETVQILSFDGTYINPRHIQLLVDSMTDSGTITNVNRNGISRNEGPIKKIMFEQPIDNIVEAAAFVEDDKLLSVSSSIMYGKIARTGTGMVSIQSMDRAPAQPLSLSPS